MLTQLSRLITHLPKPVPRLQADPTITGVTLDSRQVELGNIFVALSGLNQDGHTYIPDAVERGAAAIVGTNPIASLSIPYIQVDDGRQALATLAAAFYDFPARKLTVIGVTGTDGKTTTSSLIYHILRAAGQKVGLISTVEAVIGNQELDTGFHVTTPASPDVQRYLAQMVAAGLTHAVLEVTSHGLAQQRVAACDFDVGVVTNITHEHLDYHGSYDAYRAAKGQLLASLAQTTTKPRGNLRVAILNKDDQSYPYLKTLIQPPVRAISYGLESEADIGAKFIRHTSGGLAYQVLGPGFELSVSMNLLGIYNIGNALAAIGATVVGMGVKPDAARVGIATLEGIPGRMETIDLGQRFLAIVDFAHTPNALRRALQAARLMVPGRVIAVFGSAGLRDRDKRRLMAEISAELADLTVLTAEDPRTESLDSILTEMAAGAQSKGGSENETFWRIPDRGEAIRFALDLAQPDDVVISCGKGHEQSMCFGETEYPWDDRTAMQAALAEYLGIAGPDMPHLPTRKS
ncbi:MAG: UDP-N-acetylmuramoyl-L-alanyl-D-glutamate--2,6-diaminopimelate ligase [Chloroflexota bacterium]|nr:UDP-N-acetylmuramoyl-L-alanyl-D-glutamate--2,6-diaminopimelate ligase [Chloroflexota bacterium]